MAQYMAKYIHRISPNANDIEGPFEISDNAFSSKSPLAKAMRKAGILDGGDRLRSFRVEGDKVVTFPAPPSVWHSITLTEGAYKAPGVDYPGYGGKRTASLRRAPKRSKPKRKRARRRTARTRLRKRISRRSRVMSLPRSARWEVVESKRWVNTKNGRTASPYGSIPWTSDAEKHNWQLQNVGWTVRDNNTGTVGVGRQPWASRQEAQEAANKFNNR